MKTLIKNYTFNAAQKTITFSDDITLDSILLITNVTQNKIIYNFASIGGTLSNKVLTLNYDTTTMSNSDVLQIFVDQVNPTKSFTLQSGATALGNGTVIDVTGYSTLSLDIVISATATVSFEASNDNVNFTAISYINPSSLGGVTNSATVTIRGIRFNISALRYFRARISSYGSGTVDVTGIASTSSLNQILGTNNLSSDIISSSTSIQVAGFNLLYDQVSTNWVRQRSNFTTTYITSSARTATTNGSDVTNYNFRGIIVFLNVTVASGTGGLQIAVQIKDAISSNYKTLNTLATAIITTGQYIVQLYPGIDATNSANTQNISQVLPQTFRIQIIHNDNSSYTYSVNNQLIV